MDPFEEFESSANHNVDQQQQQLENDPAAEFLAREQAELDKIENENDFGVASLSLDANNAFDQGSQSNEQATESKSNDIYSAISSTDKNFQEPEKIKRWREEQRLRITTKDAEEEKKRSEWRESAKRDLEEWYKQRQEQLVKTYANNKATEAELKASREQGQSSTLDWDKLTKQCDFNPKANKNTKDVSRMRSILLQLKQQPLVR